jgi:predicted lipid carrier protein YhbT
MSRLQELPWLLLAPVPLALIQPILGQVAARVADAHPEVFARLGPHAGKRFLIDPVDLPFVILLEPRPAKPHMRAYRRQPGPPHDARIAGTFLDLFDMIGGALDGDALFFSRDLHVSGHTEAVVALRNALDDVDGDLIATILGALGPLHGPASLALSALRYVRGSRNAG